MRSGLVLGLTCFMWQIVTPAGADESGRHCAPNQVNCVESQADQAAGSVITDGVSATADSGGDLGTLVDGAARCGNCRWAVAPSCLTEGPVDSGLCQGALVGCAKPDQLRYRVYLRRGNGPWVLQGSVCIGPGQNAPPATDIGAEIRARVVSYLPDAHPTFQPRAGGIVNLPTLFAAGEPTTMTTEPFDVLDFSVVVTATARWRWTFEPGVTEGFAVPGGSYPNTSVSHTYLRPGSRAVRLTTYWRAQYTVDGQGPFPVPGPELTKTVGPVTVPVRSAHSQLVAN